MGGWCLWISNVAQFGPTVPPGYVFQHRSIRPLWIAGLGLFAANWGGAVLTLALGGTKGDGEMAVPIVGPWLDLAGHTMHERAAVDIASGSLQGLGLLMVAAGLLMDSLRLVRAALAGMRIVPVVNGNNLGASFAGTF